MPNSWKGFLQITDDRRNEPYRVLIIDDDPEIVAYHQPVIEGHGIDVEIVCDPLDVMGPTARFRPDENIPSIVADPA